MLCMKCCIMSFSVSNENLHGTNKDDAALIQQYISFADQEILPAAATWVFPTLGLMQYQKQVRCVFAILMIIICMLQLAKTEQVGMHYWSTQYACLHVARIFLDVSFCML